MSFIYSNFPLYDNGVWVFGSLPNKQTEFLFYAEYGDLYLDNGKQAWNRTDYERAVKQKCRKLREEKGYDYFYIDDRRAIDRRIYNAPYTTPAHEIKNFPYPRSEEGIHSLAKYRGIQCANYYAEAFRLIRQYN